MIFCLLWDRAITAIERSKRDVFSLCTRSMASLFLDYHVQLPSDDSPVCSSWCEAETVLAVALKSNEIRFFGDEVSLVGPTNSVS